MSRWQTRGAWRYIVALLLISGTSGSVATTVIAGPGDPADLAITKTDGVNTVVAGGGLTYTITASNAGPDNATGATVSDTFPAVLTATWTCVGAGGGTCTASGSGNISDTVNLPAGGSVTYTASATLSAAATGTLSNTATVSPPGGVSDPTPANNSATDTDTISPQADLFVTKTDGVNTVAAGGSVTYTITASNAGPSNASGATVSDTFPAVLTATWTCVGAGGGTCTASGSGNISDTVNLPAGGSVTYTASATLSAAATGTLSNTATGSPPGGVSDPNLANNSATDTDTISPQADLAITKTAPSNADPGVDISYTLDLTNSGPSEASSVALVDPVPGSTTFVSVSQTAGPSGVITSPPVGAAGDVTVTYASLAAGSTASFTIVVHVDPTVTPGTLITNTATVSAETADPNGANNTASGSTTIDEPPSTSTSTTTTTTTTSPTTTTTSSTTTTTTTTTTSPTTTTTTTVPSTSSTTTTTLPQRLETVTALTSSPNPSTVGQPVTFTATVTQTGGTTSGFRSVALQGAPPPDGGSMVFRDDHTVLAVVRLDAGRAVFTTSSLAAGTHTITATFRGTAAAAPSRATIVQQVDEPAPLPVTR
jgi:uncharacterized repeat protein (TIGR01451 family)